MPLWFSVKYKDGGELPSVLRGSYTSVGSLWSVAVCARRLFALSPWPAAVLCIECHAPQGELDFQDDMVMHFADDDAVVSADAPLFILMHANWTLALHVSVCLCKLTPHVTPRSPRDTLVDMTFACMSGARRSV